MSFTEAPREVCNYKLVPVINEILRTWDLEKATAASVRRHLEKGYGADLSDLSHRDTRTIIETINMFFEEEEDDENEGKGIRRRKRKRKTPEMCKVCPKLQEIVGEGPEIARAKAVKKVVVYCREKGLFKNCSLSTDDDDKLKALFPRNSFITPFHIDTLLTQNNHMQLLKVPKRRRAGSEMKTCICEQSHMRQKHLLSEEEDILSWDALPHNILVKIINQVKDWSCFPPALSTNYVSVSHSWKLAVLDLVFPPNNDVLDLRLLDSHPWNIRPWMFCHYLRLLLKCRPAAWTTLHFPDKAVFVERPHPQTNPTLVKDDILTFIAEKTQELRNLSLPRHLRVDILFSKLAPYWKNLREVRHVYVSADNFSVLQSNCKFIEELSLYGFMNENQASVLANCFPNLKSLELSVSTQPNNVLSIILDGHKNLKLVDKQQFFYRFAETHHAGLSLEPEMSVTEAPRAVCNYKLVPVINEILRTWDLEKATAASVRRHLEKDYGADLSDLSRHDTRTIIETINMFFEEEEDNENEDKGIRRRKRKRKTPEMCKVCPKLQEIVGEGPEIARAKAVKKVVVYCREKGLFKNCSLSTDDDDKLKALFPRNSFITPFHIDTLLTQNNHMQLLKVPKRRRAGSEMKTCICEQSYMRQKHLLSEEEDIRSWDALPHNILVKIINQVKDWSCFPPALSTNYVSVSHSWKLAVLDLVFPPNNDVLDLRLLDSHPWNIRPWMFCHYLSLLLKCRPAAWTTLHFPDKAVFVERPLLQTNRTLVKDDILTFIAEKTQELRNLSLPRHLRVDILFSKLAPYWKNLREVRHVYVSADNFSVLQSNCKFIEELSVYGFMNENQASVLANCFPNLKSLELSVSTQPNNVLSIILDGHKNLKLVDTQQFFYRFAETHHVESSSEPGMSGTIRQ